MHEKQYDLVVLGTGTGGGIVAHACRRNGWSVAAVDNDSPGGTCAQYGCDAKKPLVNAAGVVDRVKRFYGKGVAGLPKINWQELIEFKRGFTDPVADRERKNLAEAGIDLYEGEPRFADAHTLQVNDTRIRAGKIVIATGMKPRKIGLPGEELVTTSREFLSLEMLPKRIIFIGGGYISFEFAHVAARAGAEPLILEQLDRVLRPFDSDLVKHLGAASEDAGVMVHCNSCVDAVEETDTALAVVCRESGVRFEADLVVHGAGRVPSVDGLDLEAAGVETDNGGIAVNEFMQSVSNPDVYAVGDVSATPGPPLTPVANLEGKAVAANLLEGNQVAPSYTGIPSTVFTIPPLSMVGMTQEKAEREKIPLKINTDTLSGTKPLQQAGAGHAAYKVLINSDTDQIVGAHYLGPDSGEVINLFAVAMRRSITASQLKETVFSYPTFGSLLNWML